jgi:hypothetical protein
MVDETVHHLGNPDFHGTAIIARWHAATSTLAWANRGHPRACLVDTDQHLIELHSADHPAVGRCTNNREYRLEERPLNPENASSWSPTASSNAKCKPARASAPTASAAR